jgi:hypothetical protein
MAMHSANRKLGIGTLLFLSVTTAWAGTHAEANELQQPPAQPIAPWVITVGVPGWLPFVTGDVGLNGITTHVNVGPGDVLRRADFLAAIPR